MSTAERPTMIPDEAPPLPRGSRPTTLPPAIEPRVETPPGVEAAPLPREHTSARPHADPRAAIHDAWSRRLLRGFVALLITVVTLVGDQTGHPPPWYVVAFLAALGLGSQGALDALKRRPGTVAATTVSAVALALAGDALHVPELGIASALGVGSFTAIADTHLRPLAALLRRA